MRPEPTEPILAQLEGELKEIYAEVAVLAASEALKKSGFHRFDGQIDTTARTVSDLQAAVAGLLTDVSSLSESLQGQIGDVLQTADEIAAAVQAPHSLNDAANALLADATNQTAAALAEASRQGEAASQAVQALHMAVAALDEKSAHGLEQMAGVAESLADLRNQLSGLTAETVASRDRAARLERYLQGALALVGLTFVLMVYLLVTGR